MIISFAEIERNHHQRPLAVVQAELGSQIKTNKVRNDFSRDLWNRSLAGWRHASVLSGAQKRKETLMPPGVAGSIIVSISAGRS